MALTEIRTVPAPRAPDRGCVVTTQTVVWLRGDFDCRSRSMLTQMLIDAERSFDTDIVIDLSEIEFMDASAVGAIVGARNRMYGSSQALTIRAPSGVARRLLEWCGLADALERPQAMRGG